MKASMLISHIMSSKNPYLLGLFQQCKIQSNQLFPPGLRLHPTAGFLFRVCHKDNILPLDGGPDVQVPFLIKTS